MNEIHLAGELAKTIDTRQPFRLCALAKRSDGATVVSFNSVSKVPTPAAHAEARVARKCNHGSIVYVARVLKDGSLAMAKPCPRCELALKFRGIKTVYYSISNDLFGKITYY